MGMKTIENFSNKILYYYIMAKQGGAKEKNDRENTKTTSDTSALLNRYLVKYDSSKKRKDESNKVIMENNYEPEEDSVLYVIDVQNDFIDVPQKGLTGENGIGAFAVNNGSGFIEDLIQHIEEYHTKYKKIIFSRDFHDKEHCSFFSQDGTFPPHCVIGTKGSGFFEGDDKKTNLLEYLKTQKQGNTEIWKKIKIVFKGMHPNQDSFQAVANVKDDGNELHTTKNLLNKRQAGNCSKEEADGDGTHNCQDVFTGAKCLKAEGNDPQKNDPLSPTLFDSTPIWKAICNNFVNYETPKADNYYVCGLAGDFCVRDTALALKKSKRGANVNILHDFTRNAFLPADAPVKTTEYDPDNTYGKNPGVLHGTVKKNEKDIDYVDKLSDDVLTDYSKSEGKKHEQKGFQNYMFEMTDTPTQEKGYTYTFLTVDELKDKTANGLPEDKPLFHFITDHRQIIDDYERNGIKMLTRTDPKEVYVKENIIPGPSKSLVKVPGPSMSSVQDYLLESGGKPRRTRKRSHRTRKHSGRKQKRSKRNSRKTRRSRRKRN